MYSEWNHAAVVREQRLDAMHRRELEALAQPVQDEEYRAERRSVLALLVTLGLLAPRRDTR
jgi:hypothetical protein